MKTKRPPHSFLFLSFIIGNEKLLVILILVTIRSNPCACRLGHTNKQKGKNIRIIHNSVDDCCGSSSEVEVVHFLLLFK